MSEPQPSEQDPSLQDSIRESDWWNRPYVVELLAKLDDLLGAVGSVQRATNVPDEHLTPGQAIVLFIDGRGWLDQSDPDAHDADTRRRALNEASDMLDEADRPEEAFKVRRLRDGNV